jgi:hypothetical protein
MHRSLPSSARLAWAPSVSVHPRTAENLPLPLPRFLGQGSNLHPEDLHGMQCTLGDVIVRCLIQPWVGHIHLNKHSSNVSLLGGLLVVHGLLFYSTFE